MGSEPENQAPSRAPTREGGAEPAAAPRLRLAPGDLVGRYRLVAALGVGGMGEVWRAMDDALRREVALKVMLPPAGDPQKAALARARFTREAQTAASIRHRNLVVVHDFGEDDGRPYLVMDLEEGRSLRALVGDPAVSLVQKLRWLRDVAAGLAAMHRASVVHRDVKPENVMVRAEDGSACLVDFGIAKWLDARFAPTFERVRTMTADNVVVGTPDYLSPEARTAGVQDANGDQYAWGVTAYEVLSGVHPADAAMRPLHDDAGVPREIAALVERAMSKRATERFDDLGAIADALTRALEGGAPARASMVPAAARADAARASATSLAPARATDATAEARRAMNRRVGIVAFLIVFATGLPLLVLALGQEARRASSRGAPKGDVVRSEPPPTPLESMPSATPPPSPSGRPEASAPRLVVPSAMARPVSPAPASSASRDRLDASSGGGVLSRRAHVTTDWVREHPGLGASIAQGRLAQLEACFPPITADCRRPNVAVACDVAGGRLVRCWGRGTGSEGQCPDLEAARDCAARVLEGAPASPLKNGDDVMVSVHVE